MFFKEVKFKALETITCDIGADPFNYNLDSPITSDSSGEELLGRITPLTPTTSM